MPEELSVRMDRVERLIEVLVEKETKLDDVVTLLVEAQIKTEERFHETDERFRETARRFRDIEERFRETAERFRETEKLIRESSRETDKRIRESSRQTDERIENLVSAIGEMLRTRNGGTH